MARSRRAPARSRAARGVRRRRSRHGSRRRSSGSGGTGRRPTHGPPSARASRRPRSAPGGTPSRSASRLGRSPARPRAYAARSPASLWWAATTRPSHSMSPAANDCASAWLSSSSRKPASSFRFSAVTGGTSKPRWPSAMTSPSAESRLRILAQRADADAVLGLHPVEPQLLTGRSAAENDVGADSLVGVLADGQRNDVRGRIALSSVDIRALPQPGCALSRADCQSIS